MTDKADVQGDKNEPRSGSVSEIDGVQEDPTPLEDAAEPVTAGPEDGGVPVEEQLAAQEDAVEILFGQLSRQVESLKLTGEPTLAVSLSEVSSKSLLLAAASRFESQLAEEFASMSAGVDLVPLVEFCMNQGVIRKYHTMFDWDKSNINKFLKLFGDDFKDEMTARISDDPKLDYAVKSFMYLGSRRNLLVHEDYATFPLQDTLDELIERYRSARTLLPAVFDHLRAKLAVGKGNEAAEPAAVTEPTATEGATSAGEPTH